MGGHRSLYLNGWSQKFVFEWVVTEVCIWVGGHRSLYLGGWSQKFVCGWVATEICIWVGGHRSLYLGGWKRADRLPIENQEFVYAKYASVSRARPLHDTNACACNKLMTFTP
jgi:hypothetical protein